ncbi:unnamed protein product, partial [Musa hybrid cultivar]
MRIVAFFPTPRCLPLGRALLLSILGIQIRLAAADHRPGNPSFGFPLILMCLQVGKGNTTAYLSSGVAASCSGVGDCSTTSCPHKNLAYTTVVVPSLQLLLGQRPL